MRKRRSRGTSRFRSLLTALALVLGLVGVPVAVAIGTAGSAVASTQGDAIAAAAASQSGDPYCYDGGTTSGPSHGDGGSGCGTGVVGFDCSGLALYAVYQATGIILPHGSGMQDAPGAQDISEANLQPGDLVFFGGGSLANFEHVGIYAGNGMMWDANDYNVPVQEHSLAWEEAGLAFDGGVRYSSSSGGGGAPSGSPGGVGSNVYYTTGSLSSGDTLVNGKYINSPDNYFALIMQTDGNLVMYGPDSEVVWTSNTASAGGNHVTMETNGDLEVWNANSTQVVWSSGTAGTGAAHLSVGDDGNLAIINNASGQAVWQNGPVIGNPPTYYGSDTLHTNYSLGQDYYLRSSDNRFNLLVQANGHLILYGPMYHVLWDSGYSGGNGASLVMQSDGNLVLYIPGGTPAWATGTGGYGPSQVKVQSDGKFVVYTNSGTAIWQDSTTGSPN